MRYLPTIPGHIGAGMLFEMRHLAGLVAEANGQDFGFGRIMIFLGKRVEALPGVYVTYNEETKRILVCSAMHVILLIIEIV